MLLFIKMNLLFYTCLSVATASYICEGTINLEAYCGIVESVMKRRIGSLSFCDLRV